MKRFKVLYGICGGVLLAATLLTGTYGLTNINKEVYEKAMFMEEEISNIGFSNFKISDYKVRYFNGDNDYVMYNGEIKKEKPALGAFVATTYKVNNEYQVILPTMENFEKLVSFIGAANGIGNGESELLSYGKEEQVSTLYHEAFHAYQFTNYEDIVTNIVDNSRLADNEGLEQGVVKYIDSNDEAKKLFEEEMELLYKAYYAEDISNTTEYIEEYLTVADLRKKLLDNDLLSIERYFEAVEGTACFVETKAYATQKGVEAFENDYLGKFNYANGSGKYYTIGMIKCWILEKLDTNWMNNYDFNVDLDDILLNSIK